jgi:hypothetical protein
MAAQIQNRAPIGSLLKRPDYARVRKIKQRSARVEEPSHLVAIRQLPCLKCGMEPCGEAAHVRESSAAHKKQNTMQAKPDDKFSVPLCSGCHTRDPDSQHKLGEMTFWAAVGLNPLLVCEDLHKVSPDIVVMRAVVIRYIGERV